MTHKEDEHEKFQGILTPEMQEEVSELLIEIDKVLTPIFEGKSEKVALPVFISLLADALYKG